MRKRSDSTTTVIDKRYSRLYEHDYRTISDAVFLAKKEMGIEQEKLNQEKIASAPMRYYHEITNLFRDGTPYSKREAISKIAKIHCDKEFLSYIRRNQFRKLSTAEKLSYVCVRVHLPIVTFGIFAFLIKLRMIK